MSTRIEYAAPVPVEVEERKAFKVSDVAERYRLQFGGCALCPKKLGRRFVRDHRVPRALGGKTDLANLQLICETCDAAKTHGKGGDISSVAKAKRINRKPERKTRRPLKGRGFYKGPKRRKLSGEVVDR